MKVTSTVNAPEPQKPGAAKALNKNQAAEANAQGGENEGAQSIAQGRDFASVLDEVNREHELKDQHVKEDERTDAKTSDRAERERLVQKREDRHDGETGGGGGFGRRNEIGDTVLHTEATSARAILHIADLERIVASVRTQMLSGGRQEVTLDLHRSVLEGLRIRLTRDTQGRLNAEFIASTERVRSQLEARAPELSELLRARGVDLASLNTKVEADAGQTATGGDGRESFERLATAGGASLTSRAGNAAEVDETSGQAIDESNSTYRA
jgi:flagellar hook-length control protein FliK